MDKAIWTAYQGDFEPLLDCLTVRNMGFSREADGQTPLMAACCKGNGMVVQLLLDLQVDTLARDNQGRTAADIAFACNQIALQDKVLAHQQPRLDEQGRPIFTWDTCKHSGEDLHLDLNQGYLVCTACGLILKENALQFNTDADGKQRKTTVVRGADSEYNEWRSEEMDLADCMGSLGIVDNEEAKKRGRETSIWARRDRALAWLDARRRFIRGHDSLRRERLSKGLEDTLVMESIDEYSECGDFKIPLQPTILRKEEISRPMFKGDGKMSHECDVFEEEFIDLDSSCKKYQPTPIKWTVCKDRWKKLCVSVVEEEKKRHAADVYDGYLFSEEEREIEWEMEPVYIPKY